MKKEIDKWLKDTIESGSWKSFNSLHIDDISEEYEDKSKWIEGGLQCLKYASLYLKNSLNENEKGFLLISLKGDTLRQGINFSNSRELEKQLDSIPPSLYIYKDNWDGFVDTMRDAEEISDRVLKTAGLKSYHVEYVENGDEEYRRSIISVLDV